MKKICKAYTLAEVIIVMLIIATVVGVSIRIAKTKMDSVVSYTYYAAYETLKTVTNNIFAKYDGKPAYTNVSDNSETADAGACDGDKVYKEDGTCMGQPSTLPRNGKNFCKKFAEIVNVSGTFDEDDICKGDSINTSNPSFEGKEPDIILKNGVAIYNLSGDLGKIDLLDGNSGGTKFKTTVDGTLYDTAYYGYTVYVDIDGQSNGQNELYYDIFPFYITLSNRLVAGYDEEGAGGGDKLYLQVSVYKNVEGSTKPSWIKRSVPFNDAACNSGYISSSVNYCRDAGIAIDLGDCSSVPCTMYTIKPVKFFNYDN